jgi:hypothetical protein
VKALGFTGLRRASGDVRKRERLCMRYGEAPSLRGSSSKGGMSLNRERPA